MIINIGTKKNVDNHFVYVFQASPKRLSYFERVMCPRYAQASIFTLVAFFNLGDFGKQDRKADAIPLCRFVLYLSIGVSVLKITHLLFEKSA